MDSVPRELGFCNEMPCALDLTGAPDPSDHGTQIKDCLNLWTGTEVAAGLRSLSVGEPLRERTLSPTLLAAFHRGHK